MVYKGVGDLATRLMAEATEGTDEALSIVLPHTRQLAMLRERGASGSRTQGDNGMVAALQGCCLSCLLRLVVLQLEQLPS